uniref:Uncharacterized protein n=1 Tax=Rhizophora mucronata TaxID=61149 RepID=A0A2P2QAK5_RHIMU
MMAEMQLLMIL